MWQVQSQDTPDVVVPEEFMGLQVVLQVKEDVVVLVENKDKANTVGLTVLNHPAVRSLEAE